MKKVIAAIIALSILGLSTSALASSFYRHETALCAAVENQEPSVWVLQNLGEEFFKQQNVQTVTDYPVAIRSVFTKGQDNRVFLVSRWHGFNPDETYRFSCEWIDPDGNTFVTSSASFETPENLDPGIFFTYTAYLDVQRDLKEGQWQVNVRLNGDLVDQHDLVIASD
jgi:hypothetical protein